MFLFAVAKVMERKAFGWSAGWKGLASRDLASRSPAAGGSQQIRNSIKRPSAAR